MQRAREPIHIQYVEDLPYRPCVGVMVLNRAGLVFIGRRSEGPEHIDETHVWQMPQGGIDRDEDPWPAGITGTL
jgi:putative (di)nucleoside polyphosphate hydrolase